MPAGSIGQEPMAGPLIAFNARPSNSTYTLQPKKNGRHQSNALETPIAAGHQQQDASEAEGKRNALVRHSIDRPQ
jgi:hypothetical protein